MKKIATIALVCMTALVCSTPATLAKVKKAKAGMRSQKGETIVKASEIISMQAELFTIANMNKINMVKIPAGTFIMGSPANEVGRQPDEKQHEVVISRPFYMAETELSQKQYLNFMRPDFKQIFRNGGPWGQSMAEIHQGGPWRAAGNRNGNTEAAPMECVNWLQAVKFCKKLTEVERQAGRLPAGYVYRLPTEAEWEYACRAGTKGPFNSSSIEGNISGGSTSGFNVFANKDANAFGLYRMHMGVNEWCLDDYGPYPSTSTDPLVINDGQRKVARGGDDYYHQNPDNSSLAISKKSELLRYVRSASRSHFSPGLPLPVQGFRPVLAPDIKYPMPKVPDDLLIEPIAEN